MLGEGEIDESKGALQHTQSSEKPGGLRPQTKEYRAFGKIFARLQ